MSVMVNLHNAKIAESGSNTNGEYVKFSDGTMVAWHRSSHSVDILSAAGSWYRSGGGAVVWTYPVAFASTPRVTATIIQPSAWDVAVGGYSSSLTTQTQAAPLFVSSTSQTVSMTIDWIAVGRWK